MPPDRIYPRAHRLHPLASSVCLGKIRLLEVVRDRRSRCYVPRVMPRKSSGDNVIPLLGKERPKPPPKLTAFEQQVWRSVVDSPGGFLDGAGQLVLHGVVAQAGVLSRHAERLRRIASIGGGFEDEDEVAKAHRDAFRAIVNGLTALRATPRARMEARAARNAFEAAPSGPRPWDRIDIEATAAPVETADDAPLA